MRVITEEILRELIDKLMEDPQLKKLTGYEFESLLNESFEEIDELVVSKLRPMSNVIPRTRRILAFFKDTEVPILITVGDETNLLYGPSGMQHAPDAFIGWIPCPQFKPPNHDQ